METPCVRRPAPFVVPTSDGKLIEEYFGAASSGGREVSIARMVAPPGWSEPMQVPDFDEYTVILRGRKTLTIGDERIELGEGESVMVPKGSRVRYANPFDEEVEYISVCLPAFTPDAVHREADEEGR